MSTKYTGKYIDYKTLSKAFRRTTADTSRLPKPPSRTRPLRISTRIRDTTTALMADYNPSLPRISGRATDDTATRIIYHSPPQARLRIISVTGQEPYQFTRAFWSHLDATAAQDHALGLQTSPEIDTTVNHETQLEPADLPRKRSKSATSSRRDSGVDGAEVVATPTLTRVSTTSSLPDEDESTRPAKRARTTASRSSIASSREPKARKPSSRRGDKPDDLSINGIGIDPGKSRERVEWKTTGGKWYEVEGLVPGEEPVWATGRRVVIVRGGKVISQAT